VRHWRFSQRYF